MKSHGALSVVFLRSVLCLLCERVVERTFPVFFLGGQVNMGGHVGHLHALSTFSAVKKQNSLVSLNTLFISLSGHHICWKLICNFSDRTDTFTDGRETEF